VGGKYEYGVVGRAWDGEGGDAKASRRFGRRGEAEGERREGERTGRAGDR
jgi:hypothetical protein